MFWNKKKDPICSCGAIATNGYSLHAESDLKDIESICDICLLRKLKRDFESFEKRAVVFDPSVEFPCYIFRPHSQLEGGAPEGLKEIVPQFLQKDWPDCENCGSPSHFAWIDSLQAIVTTDTRYKSLCGSCSVERLKAFFPPSKFLEVCGPRDEDGVQLSTGY